jgi:hypothetical protein
MDNVQKQSICIMDLAYLCSGFPGSLLLDSVGSRIFSSPHRADRLWGPPSLLSNGYQSSFPGCKATGASS